MYTIDFVSKHRVVTTVTTSSLRSWPKELPSYANFIPEEFQCKDGSKYLIIHELLVSGLQQIRTLANRPVTLNSAFRTVEYNSEIGGVPDSYHTKGMAADCVIHGYSVAQMAAIAERIPQFADGGIGAYKEKWFVHVDVRKDGPARWFK